LTELDGILQKIAFSSNLLRAKETPGGKMDEKTKFLKTAPATPRHFERETVPLVPGRNGKRTPAISSAE
jgi:hypothetical protein